tara:strand:+ start:570 stop:794 length:225 start_codon:yes stop_codon:yes gene_type:complete
MDKSIMSSHLAQNLKLLQEISDDIKVIKNSQDVALQKIKDIQSDIVKLNMVEEKVKKGEVVAAADDGWFWSTFS